MADRGEQNADAQGHRDDGDEEKRGYEAPEENG